MHPQCKITTGPAGRVLVCEGFFFPKLLLFPVVKICSRHPFAPNTTTARGEQHVCKSAAGQHPDRPRTLQALDSLGPAWTQGSGFGSGSANRPPNLWSDLGRSFNLSAACFSLSHPSPLCPRRNSLTGKIFRRGNEWGEYRLHQLPWYLFMQQILISHLLHARYCAGLTIRKCEIRRLQLSLHPSLPNWGWWV